MPLWFYAFTITFAICGSKWQMDRQQQWQKLIYFLFLSRANACICVDFVARDIGLRGEPTTRSGLCGCTRRKMLTVGVNTNARNHFKYCSSLFAHKSTLSIVCQMNVNRECIHSIILSFTQQCHFGESIAKNMENGICVCACVCCSLVFSNFIFIITKWIVIMPLSAERHLFCSCVSSQMQFEFNLVIPNCGEKQLIWPP